MFAVGALFAGTPQVTLDELHTSLDLLPGDENMLFLRAGALLAAGRADEGVAELRALVVRRPSWGVLARSFVERGLLALPPDVDVRAVVGE